MCSWIVPSHTNFRLGHVTYCDQWNMMLYNFWAQASRGFATSGFILLDYFSGRTMWKAWSSSSEGETWSRHEPSQLKPLNQPTARRVIEGIFDSLAVVESPNDCSYICDLRQGKQKDFPAEPRPHGWPTELSKWNSFCIKHQVLE